MKIWLLLAWLCLIKVLKVPWLQLTGTIIEKKTLTVKLSLDANNIDSVLLLIAAILHCHVFMEARERQSSQPDIVFCNQL